MSRPTSMILHGLMVARLPPPYLPKMTDLDPNFNNKIADEMITSDNTNNNNTQWDPR